MQERELLKRARFASAMAEALRVGGAGDTTARLAAEMGVLAFSAAYARWAAPVGQAGRPEQAGHRRPPSLATATASGRGQRADASAGIHRITAHRPAVGAPRRVFEFYPGAAPLPFQAAPRVNSRPHSITAHVEIPAGGAEGLLLSQGTRHGGYALYVAAGRLCFVHNYLGLEVFPVIAAEPLPAGRTTLRMEFRPDPAPQPAAGRGVPAEIRLFYGTQQAGTGHLPYSVPVVFSSAGASCGAAHIDTVNPSAYTVPYTFTGRLLKVVVTVGGDLVLNRAAEFARLMGEQ